MKIKIFYNFAVCLILSCFIFSVKAEAGYIRTWLFCGPFGNDLSKDYLGGEQAISPAPGRITSGTGWKIYLSTDNEINLQDDRIYGSYDEGIGYGYVEVISDTETRARLLIGSSGGVKVWLNGRNILADYGRGGYSADGDKLTIRLLPGRNKLLVKAENNGGDWSFSANLIGMDGNEIPGLHFGPSGAESIK